MRGKVLGVDAAAGTGVISGGDGKRYNFVAAQWKGEGIPTPGIYVDFDSSDGETATGLFPEIKTVFQPQGAAAAAAAPPPPPPLSPVEHSATPPAAAQPVGSDAPRPNLDKPTNAPPPFPPPGGHPGGQPGPAQIRQPFPGQAPPPPYPSQSYPPPQQGGYSGQPHPGQPYQGQGHPGQPYPGQPYPGQKSKIVAGILALFFGSLGVHKFYLGYNNAGFIMLGGTILSFILVIVLIGILGLMALGTIAFVEAILYLTKSDEEFERIYVKGKRPWF